VESSFLEKRRRLWAAAGDAAARPPSMATGWGGAGVGLQRAEAVNHCGDPREQLLDAREAHGDADEVLDGSDMPAARRDG
jgi:hypothetical protein